MTTQPYQGAEYHQEQIYAKQRQLNHANVDDAQSRDMAVSLITDSKKARFTSTNTQFLLQSKNVLARSDAQELVRRTAARVSRI